MRRLKRSSAMSSILDGVRVIDFGRYIAGPFCAALLADFGADVIRVEKREGSEDRFVSPVSSTGDGSLFLQMNRNKRSMTLDPMCAGGREIVRRLVATADVVIANLPQPTLEAMGLDYPTLCAIRPDIILTSVSAFGTSGPYKDRVGFDGVGQVMSGAVYMTGEPDQPYRAHASYVDFSTALACAYGTSLALLDRARTGRGRHVEGSLLRSALNVSNSLVLEQEARNLNRVASGNRGQNSAPSDLFRTSDGWILIQVIGAPLFKRVARLVDAPEWLTDPRFATDILRGDNGAVVSGRVGAWCAARTTAAALGELEGARIPCGPVYSPQAVLDDPHVRAVGIYAPVPYPGMERPAQVARTPITLSDAATDIRRAPLLGEHTDAILAELGYGEAEIEAFEAERVI
jgi:crotonobetainyl-CoA:carnitine CoA-transferase CaiB-like acyl-CoA transferase